MGKRTYLLCFLLLSESAANANSQNTIIPPVVVKPAPHKNFTSGPKTIITRDELLKSGTASLAQALQNLGGVQLQDTTGNGSQVALGLRGFGANATTNALLLVNGIPITQPDLAPPNLNAIPLHEIELIEIISGSESVLYGDQAVGGAINIITRKKTQEIASLSCGAGSYNQYDCYAGFNHYYRNLQYNILLFTNHTENYRDHNDYDQNRLTGMLSYSVPNTTLRFDYAISNEDMQYPGALTAAQVREDRRQASNDINFFKDANAYFRLQYLHSLNQNWQLETNIMHSRMDGHGVLSSRFTQGRETDYFRPQFKAHIKQSLLRVGIELQNDYYHLNSLLGDTLSNQQKYGAFAIASIPINTLFSLSLGARAAMQASRLTSLSANNNINRVFVTTLGLIYEITPALHAYLRRAGNFRFPKADENASTPFGSTGLRTQRGISYETGLEWKQGTYAGKVGLFQLNLRDEITFDPTQTTQDPFGSNRNLSPTVRRGFTLSGKNQFLPRASLDGQINFVSALFQNGINAGNRIPLISEQIMRAGLRYQLTEHFSLYGESVFTGNQFSANDDTNMAARIGGYTVYHFHLRYSDSHLSISLRVNNILNKLYYFYAALQPSINSQFFYPAPERNFSLNVNYLF